MEKPTLLWVRMRSDAAPDASYEFTHCCRVQPIGREHLWAMASLTVPGHVICLDYDHPDLDGLKFAGETKTKFPSLPIIMVISQRSADIVLWALRSRVFDVIVKPVTSKDVARCMQRLVPILQARRAQSERFNAVEMATIPHEARFRGRDSAQHKLNRVSDYIAKNYASEIRESDLAKMCGMSSFKFSREFRATYGVTFRDYLSDYRLTQAKRLLENAEVSVTDVAAMVGCNDPSYFARLFRKRAGVTPSAYRAALKPA